MDASDAKKLQKKLITFLCSTCDFASCKKNDYLRHVKTIKHLECQKNATGCIKNAGGSFLCTCGKLYKYRQGLDKHKKSCTEICSEKEKEKVCKLSSNIKENGLIFSQKTYFR